MSLDDHDIGCEFEQSTYVKTLDVDARARYHYKLSVSLGPNKPEVHLRDPYGIPDNEWQNNTSEWPKLQSFDLYNYFIKTPGVITHLYVESGKVETVFSHSVVMGQFMFLKCKVQPSQRISECCHEPWSLLSANGAVVTAHCTCKAGLGEVCSHIGALLFKIEMAVRIGLTEVAVMSQGYLWNQQFKQSVDPVLVKDLSLAIKRDQAKKRASPKKYISPKKTKNVTLAEFAELKRLEPNAVVFSLLPAADDSDTDTASETERENELPPNLTEAIRQCSKWDDVVGLYRLHKEGCISASIMHEVAHASGPGKSVMQKIMFPNKCIKTKSVTWGKLQEETARQAYLNFANSSHSSFLMRPCGLLVYMEEPYIRASPDGIVTCTCCGTGLIEIKCPYTQRGRSPLAIEKKYSGLDASGQLDVHHKYYSQVQGQMGVSGYRYCDFVVRTPVGLHVTRVRNDDVFWSNMLQKLKKIFFDNVYPKLSL